MQTSTPNTSPLKSWIVVLCAGLFFFYEFIQMMMVNSLAPDLMRDFNVPAESLGILSSYNFWATLIFLFPAGIILDRISTKKIILTALAICVIGTLLFSQAHSIDVASLCRFFSGIGGAFCFLSAVRLASRWLPANHLALASGLIVTMAYLGGLVAQAPLTDLIHLLGWRHAILTNGVIGIIIFIIIALVVKDNPPAEVKAEQHDHQLLHRFGFWHSLQRAYLNWQNWLAGIYTNMMNLSTFVIGAIFGTVYLIQAHGLTRSEAADISGMLFLGTLLGAPFVGWLSDKMEQRLLPMRLGAIFSFIIIALILYMPHLSMDNLAILFFLMGFITSTQIISYPLVAETSPHALTATSVSVVSFNVISGGAIFQPIIGDFLDKGWLGQMSNGVRIYPIAAYQHAFSALLIAAAIAFVVTFFMKESYCKTIN